MLGLISKKEEGVLLKGSRTLLVGSHLRLNPTNQTGGYVENKRKGQKQKIALKRKQSSKASTGFLDVHLKWIRIDRAFQIPLTVKEAIRKLDEAGHVVFVVGGGVRDFLLRRPVKDFDLATSANPDELCRIFPKSYTAGKSFGVVRLPSGENPDSAVEIATFRQDLEYEDFRHPKGVIFAGPLEDAHRRDFTINALFFDSKTHRILDCVDGMKDLESRLIRAIGVPEKRFEEDALRLLRAIRFAASLDFEIEPETHRAIEKKSRLIEKISAERIRDELDRVIAGPQPSRGFRLLSELQLLRSILPELERLKGLKGVKGGDPSSGDTWERTLRALEIMARLFPTGRSIELCWATAFLYLGKLFNPTSSSSRSRKVSEPEGAHRAREIARRLKMTRNVTETIGKLLTEHSKFKEVFHMREATLERWIRQPEFENLLALHRIHAMATDGNLAYYDFCLSRYEAALAQPKREKLLDGKDLIQLGLAPSEQFSHILRTIEDLVLEDKLKTKEEALEYVVKHFVR